MAKWEYLKVSAFFAGGRPHGVIIRLTPKRESHAELLAAAGLTALEKDPTGVAPPTVPFDTISSASWDASTEKFYALIDAVTADGWEPFAAHEEGPFRQMHLRRQTA